MENPEDPAQKALEILYVFKESIDTAIEEAEKIIQN